MREKRDASAVIVPSSKIRAHGANHSDHSINLRALRSRPVKSFSKVWRKVQIGRKTVYEIDPISHYKMSLIENISFE